VELRDWGLWKVMEVLSERLFSFLIADRKNVESPVIKLHELRHLADELLRHVASIKCYKHIPENSWTCS